MRSPEGTSVAKPLRVKAPVRFVKVLVWKADEVTSTCPGVSVYVLVRSVKVAPSGATSFTFAPIWVVVVPVLVRTSWYVIGTPKAAWEAVSIEKVSFTGLGRATLSPGNTLRKSNPINKILSGFFRMNLVLIFSILPRGEEAKTHQRSLEGAGIEATVHQNILP